MDKSLKNALIVSILLISFSIAFYLLYYLPNKEHTLENAKRDCSLIEKKALSEEERAQAKKAWDENNCENQQSGFVTIQCVTNKEKMNRAKYKTLKASLVEFNQCLREKGF